MLHAPTLSRRIRRLFIPALLGLAAAAHGQGFNDLYLGTGAGNPGTSTGNRNTALGEFALSSNTSGSDNTAVGSDAMLANTIGGANTALGSFALLSNTNGSANVAIGGSCLVSNTTGAGNTGVGASAMTFNTSGSNNTAIGLDALANSTTGANNTALGSNALVNNSNGSSNIAIGLSAGHQIVHGSNNIDIGNLAPGDESDTIRIGTSQTSAFLAGVNGVTISSGTAVFVNSSGQLGTMTSSLRFKEDVQGMGEASDGLLQLRPVTFRYKTPYDDGSHLKQYGLIAEEVAKVFPDLVQLDAQGKPFAVRYQSLDAMLVNELQKEHAALASARTQVSELEAQVARQQAAIESQKRAADDQEARLLKLEARLAATPQP
ncbi:MAG TPA: tail fiber domain-containing protein [Thermoanaerobaculia bacterium]